MGWLGLALMMVLLPAMVPDRTAKPGTGEAADAFVLVR